ncbi:MAG: thiol:disulfide interchange protein DsbA/DsbL [Gammaproteobacteria bacterium]|jgi:protein dithiol oxidoreductase (disulfide-forming)|nr:thiol:disulfide interchange protein DsbA/DsbL [Gammaproteobacteria bacterium]MBT5202441.1 thiol:disulfide interchange protein DsbA/DsbL [Gammaproteobacteria bacterium]MBT5602069.1 thiol:disulfide interchange protein DsbA/DsbL [Gammaproteobacteria bacterium]MBT6247384.1 thiol:disulfide interchange protein DsbA/DsbL [Gammaproteobacteria bacterium]
MVKRSSFLLKQKLAAASIPLIAIGSLIYLVVLSITDDTAQGIFREGQHYTIVENPRRIRGENIEVMEFFSYGCIHCYNFDEPLTEWVNDKKDAIQLVRTPLMGNENWRLLGKHYYTLEQLKQRDRLHHSSFVAIHDRGKVFADVDNLADFFADDELPYDPYISTFNSPSVMGQINLADQLSRRFKISSVPTLIVHGKYKVAITSDIGPNRMLEVVDHLIDKIRAEAAP